MIAEKPMKHADTNLVANLFCISRCLWDFIWKLRWLCCIRMKSLSWKACSHVSPLDLNGFFKLQVLKLIDGACTFISEIPHSFVLHFPSSNMELYDSLILLALWMLVTVPKLNTSLSFTLLECLFGLRSLFGPVIFILFFLEIICCVLFFLLFWIFLSFDLRSQPLD